MSDKAVEAAASILYQKIEQEHRKHSTASKHAQLQKKNSTGSNQLQKKVSSCSMQHPVLQKQCSCEEVKAQIEAGKKSSVIMTGEHRCDKLRSRRAAVAEKNETERILTKESVKVLAKNTSMGSINRN